MSCLIGFGRWNPYYYYILVSMLTRLIKEDILGVGTDIPIIPNLRLGITHHPIMILLLGYSSDLIISSIIILFMYIKKSKEIEEKENLSRKNSPNADFSIGISDTKDSFNINDDQTKDDNKKIENSRADSNIKFELIHNDLTEMKIEIIKKNSFKFIIISAVLIIIKEIFIELIYSSNDIFNYYFLNLVVVALILRYFFKEKIYNHQILAIISVIVISGSFLIACIFVIQKYEKDNDYNLSFNFQNKEYLIFILIFVYIIISISFSAGIIFQKNIMQLKFVSYSKILFWKGLIGVGLCIIGLIISSNVPCANHMPPPRHGRPPPDDKHHHGPGPGPGPGFKMGNNTNDSMFEIFVCTDFDFQNNKSYFDNFLSYFAHFSGDNKPNFNRNNTNNNDENIKDNIIKEVFISLGYFILHFISELSLILVNKFLTPIHYLITESLYNLFHIPFEILARHIFLENHDEFSKDDIQYDYKKVYNIFSKNDTTLILKLVAVFFELLGYLIYMEIIQLNFCGLSKNVATNIEERAKIEYAVDNFSESDYNINDFDGEESNKS